MGFPGCKLEVGIVSQLVSCLYGSGTFDGRGLPANSTLEVTLECLEIRKPVQQP